MKAKLLLPVILLPIVCLPAHADDIDLNCEELAEKMIQKIRENKSREIL